MGVTIVREFARLRIRRVPFLGVPREFVRDRARASEGGGWCRKEQGRQGQQEVPALTVALDMSERGGNGVAPAL